MADSSFVALVETPVGKSFDRLSEQIPFDSCDKSAMGPPGSTSVKRRRIDASSAAMNDSFYITPQPKSSALSNSPILITPKAVLSRMLIPLHWTVSSAPPRTFTARLPSLDTPGTVLIVKYENERQLAAVERVDFDKFVLLRISSSVKLADVKKLMALSKKVSNGGNGGGAVEAGSVPFGEMSVEFQEDWWTAIKAEESMPARAASERSELLSISSSKQMKLMDVMKSAKSPKPSKPEAETTDKPSESLRKPSTDKIPKEKKGDTTKPRQSSSRSVDAEEQSLAPEEILSQIRSQYFEALYIAKTPLAYFAKSTLAKARNTFRLDNPAPNSRLDLLKFLKTLRVPLKRMDKKFQVAIGQVANEVAVQEEALFSEGEQEYVDRWVAKTMSDEKTRDKSATQNEQRLKRKISDLRLREIELQIILMLEILAISSKFPKAVIENLDVGDEKDTEKEKIKGKKSKKTKKSRSKDDMNMILEPKTHLDLLVDRLCIWQLVGSAMLVDDAPSSSQQQQSKDNRDHIEHFATEVVMTFFSSRLPDICQVIKRRCSGKTPVSNYTDRKAAANEAKQKQALEQKSAKEKESAQPQRPPSLARSVTAPASIFARTEREGSVAGSISGSIFGGGETQYTASIKPAESLNSISRGGVMTSKNLQKRQVQIGRKKPAAKFEESQKLQQEIKSAIQGIAKPNRAAAAKELTTASADRLRGTGKKSQRPQHKPKTNVQVAATPRTNRRIQDFNKPRPLLHSPIVEEERVPSSDIVIPQSTVKKRKDFGADIFDEEPLSTPTRAPGPVRHRAALLPSQNYHQGDNINSSPMFLGFGLGRSLSDSFAKVSHPKKDFIEDTPQKPKDRENIMHMTPGASIQETPTKPVMATTTTPSKRRFDDYDDRIGGGVSLGSPLPPALRRCFTAVTPANNKRLKPTPLANASIADSPSGNDGGVSIYDELGWNDDY